MSEDKNVKDNEKKNDKRIWLLILLVFLLVFCCVFGYRAFGMAGKLFNQEEEQGESDSGEDQGNSNQTDTEQGDIATDSESESAAPEDTVNPVDFDDDVYYTGVEFADPMDLEVEFLEASAFADGSAMLTFGTSGGGGNAGKGGLPPGEYTASVDTGTGEAVAYECGLNSAEPDKLYCYGPKIPKNTPVVTEISYTSADYVLAGQVKGTLAEATASNLPVDFSDLNEAADSLGLGEVDNPYEAWGVIGCCIQNIGPDGLPEGCEGALSGLGIDINSSGSNSGNNGSEGGLFGGVENPEQAWQALMDQYNAPQDWTGSPGSLNPTAQQAIFDSANACAAALGYPLDEIDNLTEARMLFDLIWTLDPRRETNDGPGGFWGAMYDFFGGIVDSFEALIEVLSGGWPDDWGILGDVADFAGDFWDKTFGGMLSTVLNSVCLTFYLDDPGTGLETCDQLSEAVTGSDTYWNQFGSDGPHPTPIPLVEFPPQACLEFVDHSKEHTYFAMGSSGFIGNQYSYAGTPMAYCAEAMGFGYTPNEIRPYMDNDYMYDKIIESYGHVGNPAMPDPCRMVVQWCDSDQYASIDNTGQAVAEGSFQAGFANLNGCNDPQSFAEAAAWTGSVEEPDCDALGEVTQMLSDLTGADISTTLYCQGVEAFGDSPIGDVAACAEELGYSGLPMSTTEDYMDFMAWIGLMDTTLDVSWSANCQTAIDFAQRFGFVEQSIDTAASSCSQGGPQKLNSSPVEFTMPAVIVPVYNSDGGGGGGGGGGGNNSCSPKPCSSGLYWEPNSCSCQIIN